MVDISVETVEATEVRLRKVFQASELEFHSEPYVFEEFTSDSLATSLDRGALALVRDGEVWCQLVSCRIPSVESFGVFCCHFPPDLDNSGFVGWLATHLKRRFGTGVFVICGQNSSRGGIYDYWGFPFELTAEVKLELRAHRMLN